MSAYIMKVINYMFHNHNASALWVSGGCFFTIAPLCHILGVCVRFLVPVGGPKVILVVFVLDLHILRAPNNERVFLVITERVLCLIGGYCVRWKIGVTYIIVYNILLYCFCGNYFGGRGFHSIISEK